MKILLVLLLLFPTLTQAANVEKGFIVLLQPDMSLREKDPDMDSVSDYIKVAQNELSKLLASEKLPKASGFMVFAIRTGGLSNVWLDFKPGFSPELEAKILHSLKAIPPFKVAKGTMVFALSASINGADQPAGPTPFPKEWQAAMSDPKEPMEVEALVLRVWP